MHQITDPVTGFVYPAEWIARCTSPTRLKEVVAGLSILTSRGTLLRRGFTTGTSAAAACKAAVLALDHVVTGVDVLLPCGMRVHVPAEGRDGDACCVKYGGDHPADVTAGLAFLARAQPADAGCLFEAGEGIGIFVRDTPRFRVGAPSISSPVHSCIMNAIEEAVHAIDIAGVVVTLRVPRGKEAASHTLNAQVGVEGGISLLGTTGLVEPWDDHQTESILDRIRGEETVVLTTGRTGLRYSRLMFPDRNVLLAGGRFPEVIAAATGEVILCGLPGLILRYLDPHILEGTAFRTVEEMTQYAEFLPRARKAIDRFRKAHPRVRVLLIDREGAVVVDSG